MRLQALVATLLVTGTSAHAADGATHPFGIHDMLAMQRISEPAMSPDGGRVVFTLRTTDLDANRGRTDLWMAGSDGQGLRQLTTDEDSDSMPRWAPDGTAVFFLSSRSGASQVWRLPLDGGEAQPVTDLPLGVGSFALSPDGSRLVVSLDVFPDCEELACTTERLAEQEAAKTTGRLYDRLFVRHWDSWKDGRRSHLFVVPVNGGAAIDVMRGMDADCPSRPFGGPEEYSWTPDGKQIVFSARDVGREEAWSTDFDLFRVAAEPSASPEKITTGNRAWDTQPVFSPDGARLAYLAMDRPGYESDRLRIVLMSWPDGEPQRLTESWDRSPRSITWSEDGKSLYANAGDLGQTALFAIDARTGDVRKLVGQGTVRAVAPGGGRVLFARDNLNSPVELYTIRPDGTDEAQVTRINEQRLAATQMGEAEQFDFKGWNDEKVYAYVVKPAGFKADRKYPVAFLIHGGPQGSFGNDFHYRWNPQAYAGAGYAVVMVDFHGSTGYGQAFTDSIGDDWGGKPLVDLQKGLAAALEKYPFMDGERVCALGASYGGYMINWIAGNWPDRFRCLVNHDGNLDERLAYYDTEELWFPEWERGGPPWQVPEAYARHNPIEHVGKWKTPMLVIHGALDYRVVDTQGISTFTALQRRGIPSQLLYFPDENHWVLKPHNSIQWHDSVIGWIDEWTKKPE